MLVQDFLTNSAERFPGKTALVCGNRRHTYDELFEMSRRLARALATMGIRRQDRVAIFCDNSVESVVALFGTLMVGGIFVLLNPAMKARKLAYILNHSGAHSLIAQANKAAVVRAALSMAPEIRHLVWVGPLKPGAHSPQVDARQHIWEPLLAGADPMPGGMATTAIDVDLAAIIYTSGTTGDPKGVMATHCNMVAVSSSIIAYLKNTADDIILDPLPLSYGYGLYQLLTAFGVGATVVFEPSFAFPYRVMERVVREKVTGIPMVPTIVATLLQMTDFRRFDLGRLRYITNAAAALPVAHIRRLMELLPHVRIFSMYGLTECQRVSYLPPGELARRPDSVGIPIPNCEVFVLNGEDQELGPGQVGELVVRGSNVMQGYWNAPDETAKCFRPGRYRGETLLYTGDLFRKDEEGYLYFVARKDDIIKTKGERVSPREIEEVVCALEGVVESAVIGVPDDILGQAVKLFVAGKADQGLTADSVRQHCKRHLEAFMVPKYIEFREALPKSASGKIDKKQLN